MATVVFSVLHTDGKTVYFRFFDTAQGARANLYPFDFDDNAWETTLAGCTTPKLSAAEKTDAGDADESLYTASTDLANMNSTTTPLRVTAQAMDDLGTDELIATMEFMVVSGEMVEIANVEQIEGGDASSAINAEVVDALNVDTYAEPGTGAPAATTSLVAKIGYLFKAWRNKTTQTSSEQKLYDDAGSTVDQKSADSDDGVTFTKGEMGTGA